MTGWEWVALLAALVGIPAAIVYAVQGSLAEAFEKGYRQGHEEGFAKGFFEGGRTVRAHRTPRGRRTVRQARKNAEGDGDVGPSN